MANFYSWNISDFVVFVLLCCVAYRWITSRRLAPLPPGPKGLPVLGNSCQIPAHKQWLKFDEWIKEYGDLVYINIRGQPTLVVGSIAAANDLLDGRGNIYSDRPVSVMAGEIVGWDRGLGYAPGPHDPRFRKFRKLFAQYIGPKACNDPQILDLQEKESRRLACRLLRTPERFMKHFRRTAGSTILSLAYGYQVTTDNDPMVKIAERAMEGFASASEPNAFMVDNFPFLKHIPKWFPGGGFKETASEMFEDREKLYEVPFNFVREQMGSQFDKGQALRSFISASLETRGDSEGEELIKAAAASLYSGGIDTTPSSLSAFVLAMALYPRVQARAQAEFDEVLGSSFERLPCFRDRQKMPYVNAMVKELLRWNPAVPLGLAHRLSSDDSYREYFLPKGLVVWANIWTMTRDPDLYPSPDTFDPERFLDDEGNLKNSGTDSIPFGFGRRICPGLYFAENSIWIAIATILYCFEIKKAKDENGVEIEPVVNFDGFISHPKPFECTIELRSEAAKALLREETAQNK